MQQLDLNYELVSGEARQHQILQVLLLLIISTATFVSGIGKLTLIDPDESRYTLISRNMIERGNYGEPWLGNEVYTKKPPLYFWLTAGSLKLFGVGNLDFSARIVPVVGAVLTILATYLIASAMFNHMIGLISSACLLTTVAMVGFGKFVRMDIYLTAFISLALWAFIKGYKTGTASRWYVLMYPLMALAILTKGPIGLLPLVMVLILLFWQRNWAAIGHLKLILGLAIIIAMAGPWFLYMSVTHSGYAADFFVKQNLDRVTTDILGHMETPFVYLAALLIGLAPWTGLFVLAFARYLCLGLSRDSGNWETRLLLVWLIFVMAFFSVVNTKLSHYILPAFVPSAILLGRFMYDYWQSDFPRRRRQLSFAWAYPMGLVAGLIVVLMFVVSALGGGWLRFHEQWTGPNPLYDDSWWRRWGWMISLVYRLALAGVLVKLLWYLWRNWQLPQLVTAIGVACVILTVDLSYTELPKVADLRSSRRLVPVVAKNSEAGEKIVAGPEERWSLPLYLGRSHTVLQIKHLADLTELARNPGEVVYLSTDDDSFVQAKGIMRDRVKVLAEYRDTRLLQIAPQPALPLAENLRNSDGSR